MEIIKEEGSLGVNVGYPIVTNGSSVAMRGRVPGVRFLTGQSGFLAICPVKNMMLNRTISCPVFSRP